VFLALTGKARVDRAMEQALVREVRGMRGRASRAFQALPMAYQALAR
jgi:hypothetical protein